MSDKTRGGDRLIIGGVPRADLLPPEFAAEAKLRAQRRGMVFLAALATGVVAAAYVFVTIQTGSQNLQLDAANAETVSLLAQQEQYAEVGQINSQIATIKVAELIGTSTQIDWREYLALVSASLPAGTVINTVTAGTAYPGAGATTASSPLGFTSIAEIAFSAETTTLPNVSSWIENLAELPGFAGATAGSITRCPCGTYTVSMVLYVNEGALANRIPFREGFEPQPEPTPTPSETSTPAPTPTATSARAVVGR